ncbi:uncharacterized protein [Drosophila kikkawai]|uniref:Uncharacterized protein n=1 Tax=Drosophila kikkawai TaxID=30033 RepID=A0ABM4GHX0_DROKI
MTSLWKLASGTFGLGSLATLVDQRCQIVNIARLQVNERPKVPDLVHEKSGNYPLYPVKGLRPSSLRKSSSTSSSSINNACPPPPPTPHQVNPASCSSSSTPPHSQHPHPHHHQHHQHRRSSSSSHTSHQLAENSSGLATKPAINLLGNQLQVNYFEFPPTASGQALLANSGRTTASTPSLNCHHQFQQPQQHSSTVAGNYSSAVAKAAASTACALLATCHVSRDSPRHYHHQQQLPKQPRSPEEPQQTADNMGRREIKRSNTSGSTTRSYDSGSDVNISLLNSFKNIFLPSNYLLNWSKSKCRGSLFRK